MTHLLSTKGNGRLWERRLIAWVQAVDCGTFLLATLSDSSCLPIDPRQTGVEPRPGPQAPTGEPSALAPMSRAGLSREVAALVALETRGRPPFSPGGEVSLGGSFAWTQPLVWTPCGWSHRL